MKQEEEKMYRMETAQEAWQRCEKRRLPLHIAFGVFLIVVIVFSFLAIYR